MNAQTRAELATLKRIKRQLDIERAKRPTLEMVKEPEDTAKTVSWWERTQNLLRGGK